MQFVGKYVQCRANKLVNIIGTQFANKITLSSSYNDSPSSKIFCQDLGWGDRPMEIELL